MTSTLDDARGELLACPFCGEPPYARAIGGPRGLHIIGCKNDGCEINPKASGETSHEVAETWNTRAAPGPQCDAVTADDILSEIVEHWNELKRDEGAFPPGDRRAAMSEHRLWHAIQVAKAWLKTSRSAALVSPPSEAGRGDYFAWDWQGLLWDALGDQTKVDRVLALARERGMFDPVRLAALSRPSKAGMDALIERCAKIADPWPGFNVGQKISEPDLSVIEVRSKIASAIRALSRDQGTVAVSSGATAEDIYACARSTLLGFRSELSEIDINFICDQISRKATLSISSANRGGEA